MKERRPQKSGCYLLAGSILLLVAALVLRGILNMSNIADQEIRAYCAKNGLPISADLKPYQVHHQGLTAMYVYRVNQPKSLLLHDVVYHVDFLGSVEEHSMVEYFFIP